jgi:hypothetical protein
LPGIISTDWNAAQRQAVARLDGRLGAVQQLRADTDSARRDDVATLTVGIAQQRQVRGPVRVVFDAFDPGGNAVLVAPEVDHAVVLLVAAALVANGDMAVVVATGAALLRLEQGRNRLALVQARGHNLDDRATTCRSGFDFNQCHGSLPY